MRINNGVVLSTKEDLRAAYRLATHGIRALQRNGHRVSPTDRQLVADLGLALSDHGHSDVRTIPENAYSPVTLSEPVTTADAARALGISQRQARRLAPRYAVKTGGTWLWEASTLDELLKERKECLTHEPKNYDDELQQQESKTKPWRH